MSDEPAHPQVDQVKAVALPHRGTLELNPELAAAYQAAARVEPVQLTIDVKALSLTPSTGRLHYVLPNGTEGVAEGLLENGIPVPAGARIVRYDAPPIADVATVTIGAVKSK